VDLEQRLREGPLRVRTAWSPEQSARLPRQVVRLRRRRSLARVAFAAGVMLCVTTVLVARVSLRTAQPQVVAAPHTSAAPVAAATPASIASDVIALHDGSRAEPIDHDTRVAVISDRPEHVQLQLQRGGARFDVVHNPERAFEVQAGPVLVRVAGTIFDVTRSVDGTQTTVAVERGRVHVTWAGQTVDLITGESRIFPPPAPRLAETPEPQAAHKSDAALGWRDLARRGEYRQAYSALHGARTHVQDAPEDLMLAADVARLSGHPEQAVPQLRAVAERFPNDPRAPVAAFTLGGVLLHELEQPRGAAAAFHRARALWSQGPLALDAWASEAEALHAAGDTHAAAQLAARYLVSHPDGRHARSMRAIASAE
jgi:transmembrane sensor